jgi:hypothetical protein
MRRWAVFPSPRGCLLVTLKRLFSLHASPLKFAAHALFVVTVTIPTIGRAQTPALLLYGNYDHQTFLGCINCSKTDAASICNQFEQFGSQFEADSIWNMFGTYGSKFNADSPWNKFSEGSVVIVDQNGGFYGYLTANKFADKRTNIAPLNQLAELAADSSDLTALRNLFCGS